MGGARRVAKKQRKEKEETRIKKQRKEEVENEKGARRLTKKEEGRIKIKRKEEVENKKGKKGKNSGQKGNNEKVRKGKKNEIETNGSGSLDESTYNKLWCFDLSLEQILEKCVENKIKN